MVPRFSVASKLFFLVLVLCTAIIGVGAYGIVKLNSINQNIKTLYEDRVFPTEQLTTIRYSYATGVLFTIEQLKNGTISFADAQARIEKAEETIANNWHAYKLTYLTADEKKLVAEMEKTTETARTPIEQIKTAIKTKNRGAVNSGYADLDRTVLDVISKANELVQLQIKVSRELYENSSWVYLSTVKKFWYLIAVALSVAFIVSFFIVADIRDLIKKLEESNRKIAKSEAKCRAFIKYAGDSIIILDSELRITEMNNSACALLGYTNKELTGMNVSGILPVQEIESHHTVLELVKGAGGSIHERKFRRKDGGEVDTEVNVRVLEGIGYVAVIRDIKERKIAEAAIKEQSEIFSAIIENANESMWLLSPGLKVLQYNKTAKDRLLLNRGKEIYPGANFKEFLYPGSEDVFMSIFNEALAGKYPDRESCQPNIHGEMFWLRTRMYPVYDIEKKMIGITVLTENITNRKKIEKKLEQSEERNRALIENISDAILLTNEDARIIYQSPAVGRITGYRFGDDGHMKVFGFIHPDDIQIGTTYFQQAMTMPGTPVSGQFRILHKEGHYIWIEGTIVNLLQNEGINGIIVNFRDITERIKAAEVIKESEQNYRSLFEQASDVIIITDLKAAIIEVNTSACQMFGYTRQEMLEKNVADLIEPEQLKNDPLAIEALMAGKHNIRRRVARRKDGETFELESNAKRIFADRILIIARDITELRKAEKQIELSEEKHRALIENISDAIFLMNKNAEIIYRSPSAERISGYAIGEMTGKSAFDFVHPDDLDLVTDAFRRSAGLPGGQVQYELRIRHKNGHYMWVEGNTLNLLHNTSIKAFVVNYRDITDRKNAENKIHELNESLEQRVIDRTGQLQEANKALEAFSYSVSHDLKAPARAITSFTKIIDEEYSAGFSPPVKELFGYISNSGKRMTTIIDDLLTLAKYEKVMPQQKIVDMDNLFRAVWDKIGIYGNGHQATLKIDTLPPAYVDASLVEQVVVNLLSNAAKYSSKKENPIVTVGFERGDDTITYMVKDNGAGFDMKNYNKLFGAFQRLHGASEFEGTGVGLLLVKRIIEKHGGVVRAEGMVNEGATFYFTLPVINAD